MFFNGGANMQYEMLRRFACRGGAEPMRLNVYVSYDPEEAVRSPEYRDRQENFHYRLRDFGYKVITKEVKWYGGEGKRIGKANTDIDMAVDCLIQSEALDRVVLVTGDGDFTKLVRALQQKGMRVEVIAFDNVSADLRREADMFLSGYLIPGLLPGDDYSQWGSIGSTVRGVCQFYDKEKRYGYFRYISDIEGNLLETDRRTGKSPYGTAFFSATKLPRGSERFLAMGRGVFSFRLSVSSVKPNEAEASDIQLVTPALKRQPAPSALSDTLAERIVEALERSETVFPITVASMGHILKREGVDLGSRKLLDVLRENEGVFMIEPDDVVPRSRVWIR